MTTMNLPPTPPVAEDLRIMKTCKRNPSRSIELIDDVDDANVYQLSAKDRGKLMDSKEKVSNIDYSPVDVIEFNELLQSVMLERDDELIHGVQVATQQEPKDDNRESSNEQKSHGVALDAAVHRDNTTRFGIKKCMSLLNLINRFRRITDEGSPKEVNSRRGMLNGNAVAACQGSQSQNSKPIADIGTTSDRKDDSTDTEKLDNENVIDCTTSSERYFGEIVSITESYEISATNLDASLLDGPIEGGILAEVHDSYRRKDSEMYQRDAVTCVDSGTNVARRFDSSLLSTDETAIGISASKYDSDDENSSEKCYKDVVTLIESTDNSVPELHPSLLNSLPPIEGLPPDDYESDDENSSELCFEEVVTFYEAESNNSSISSSSMVPFDSSLFVGKTEVGETATEKNNSLVGVKNTLNSDSDFEKEGKRSFEKNMAASKREEEFEDRIVDVRRMFEDFEPLLEVKSTDSVFAKPRDMSNGDKIV